MIESQSKAQWFILYKSQKQNQYKDQESQSFMKQLTNKSPIQSINHNEYMKRATSPRLNIDSKTIQCITRFQLIPPNLVSKDNPIFSAFSKPKFRRPYILDPHEQKNTRPQYPNHQINHSDQNTYKSLLLGKGKQQLNMFQGLLKARKSHMKKINLKEFYIEEYDAKKDAQENIYSQNQTKTSVIQSKNSTEFNTIDSRHSQAGQKNFFLPSRKKLLPAKLRAKSYSKMPKNQRERSTDMTQDQNNLFIKVKTNKQLTCVQRSTNMAIQHQKSQNQQSIKINYRRNLRTCKVRKISHFQQKQSQKSQIPKGLQDITLQMNQQSVQLCSQKDFKHGFQRHNKHRKGLRSQHLSKLESIVDINPWMNHHEDDKENQFFVCM